MEAIASDGDAIFRYRAKYARLAGKLVPSERYARAALKRNAAMAENHIELALTLIELDRVKEAKGHLHEAHRLSPAQSRPLQMLAVLKLRENDFPGATRLLEQAYATRERNAEVTWRLASMRVFEERPKDAEALLRELPKSLRSDPEVIQNLVAGDLKTGHPERARTRLRDALGARPREPQLEKMLGIVERMIAAAEAKGGTGPRE